MAKGWSGNSQKIIQLSYSFLLRDFLSEGILAKSGVYNTKVGVGLRVCKVVKGWEGQ